MELQERQGIHRFEQITNESQQEVEKRIASLFPEQATLYAVLDFAVCFGIYKEKRFLVGTEEQTYPVRLEWEYLQELRVFDKEKEIYLVPSEKGWSGRIRRDDPDREIDKEAGEFIIVEYQKLEGERREAGKAGWSLLVSGRGSQIKIPVDTTGLQEYEGAIKVHRYMRIPDVDQDLELVFQKDIRMVELCSWRKGDDDNGRY